MKVVFFGSSQKVIPILNALKNDCELKLVITTEQSSQDPVPFFCKTNNIDFISLRKSADLINNTEILRKKADLAVVADFGLIIPQQTFKDFTFGMINVHPSLLPKYRGATPVQSAILNGESKTGVSIIQLDKYVDHGPILTQVEEEIKPDDNAKTLYERLFKIGAKLVIQSLPGIQNESLKPKKQDEKEASFTKMLTREDGFLTLEKILTEKEFFERMVRAYYPWPGVWTTVKLNEEAEKIVKFLPENKIQVEGRHEMSYKDFINGYPNANKNLLDFLKKYL